MRRTVPAVSVLLSLGCFAAQTFAAAAPPPQRTFVSAVSGVDSGSCTRSSPCRNFAAAIAAVNADGEVVVLDSGGYGSVVITKPVSLIAPAGVIASVTGFSDQAIAVNPGGGIVNLRGLYLNSQGAPTGIEFASGDVLHVENCVINGFPLSGISVWRVFTTGQTELVVSDTTIRNGGQNTPQSRAGIYLNVSSNSDLVYAHVNALIERSHIDRYYAGVYGANNFALTMRDSSATSNYFGVVAQNIENNVAFATIDHCLVAYNQYGVLAGLDSVPGFDYLMITNSTFVQNFGGSFWLRAHSTTYVGGSTLGNGFSAEQGPDTYVISYGDNHVFDGNYPWVPWQGTR